MAPDRPDASDVVTNGIPIATSTYGLCNTFGIKESDSANHQQYLEESMVHASEIVIEEEVKPEINEKPINQSDDDLTSLSWLHQQNLLKGLDITEQQPIKNVKDENILNNNVVAYEDSLDTSENTNSVSSLDESYYPESNGNPGGVCSPQFGAYDVIVSNGCSPPKNTQENSSPNGTTRNKHPTHIPYDPHLHKNSKPPYSFSCLIFMAIEDSPVKALPVKEVYAWILEHFPYFRNAPTGWKNSVRHNLSLNKCFRKVEKSPVSVSPDTTLCNLGKGSLWMVDAQYRPNLLQALSRCPYPLPTNANIIAPEKSTRKSSNTRLPDPVLFPYLSKRLASSNIDDNSDADFDSDVDAAAAAMLSFKHGPIILNHNKVFINEDNCNDEDIIPDVDPKRKNPEPDKMVPVITRSCTEDHTYSLITSVRLERRQINTCSDIDEQRKIAEGADALLNLAGVTTESFIVRDPLDPEEEEGEFDMLYGPYKNALPSISGSDPLEIRPTNKRRSSNTDVTNKRRKRPWQEAWNANGRYPKQVRG
ncbi:forkhead box protein N2-like [Phymastichus coffea]|uniref:forkhead box protein N2-like n=1 Tax=Phymastichus coffea TaxID=108790 RepID=UPI00273B1EA1|nr:forkhead box protein N2-like [Phymastichus coffea]